MAVKAENKKPIDKKEDQPKEDGLKAYKVKFIKPVQGFGYHTGDEATIKLTAKKHAQLVDEKFIEDLK